jgi:hypothetical protein
MEKQDAGFASLADKYRKALVAWLTNHHGIGLYLEL